MKIAMTSLILIADEAVAWIILVLNSWTEMLRKIGMLVTGGLSSHFGNTKHNTSEIVTYPVTSEYS